MTSEIIVALLGLMGTLAGSFLGVVAAGKLTQYRLRQLEEKALCTYLCYTVRNTALNQLRKDGLRQKILVRQDSAELQADPTPGPEELLLRQERTDRFRSVLETLPHEERTLLLDKYLLGRSNEALAKELDCKPESIRMKLTRVRRKVLALMEEGEDQA